MCVCVNVCVLSMLHSLRPCHQRLLHAIWDRCAETRGLACSLYFICVCVSVCVPALCGHRTQHVRKRRRSVQIKRVSLSVYVCLCAPIPDYPQFIFQLPTHDLNDIIDNVSSDIIGDDTRCPFLIALLIFCLQR